MELTMFERLVQLPLFQGLTIQELSEMLSHVRLDFVKYQAGDEIVVQGDACKGLVYIINGDVSAEYRDAHNRFVLQEELPQTGVLEPYNMFGLYQKYSRSYSFATDGITLFIEKPVVLRQLVVNDIVKMNILNITCHRYQQTQRLLCNFPENTVMDKIVKFLLSYSTVPKGKKELFIKMNDLADIVHETRLNVSKALNTMQEQGLVGLSRGAIKIKNLQDLYR